MLGRKVLSALPALWHFSPQHPSGPSGLVVQAFDGLYEAVLVVGELTHLEGAETVDSLGRAAVVVEEIPLAVILHN